MSPSSRGIKFAAAFLSVALAASFLPACSQTAAPQPNIVERAQGETTAPTPRPSGFLGADYALLKPAGAGSTVPSITGPQQQQAALAYIAPGVNFSQYNQIIIDPVTYWADSDSTLPANQQQVLCNYFYNVLQQDFSKNFTLVTDPGPNTVRRVLSRWWCLRLTLST